MSERALLARTVSGLLEHGDLRDARAGLWDSLHEHGLAHPFQAGVTQFSDAAAIISESSRFAPGLPLAENIVASFLLRERSEELPGHRITVMDPERTTLSFEKGCVRGKASLVPHSAVSSHAIAQASTEEGPVLVCIELRGTIAHPGENIAREPRDELVISNSPAFVIATDAGEPSKLLLLGALARAIQIATLAEVVLALSLEHTKTREQFGKPVSSFQAVQHALSVLAGRVAAAQTSVAHAEACVDRDPSLASTTTQRAIASAKIEAGRAAQVAVSTGHALHGAMGFAREHRLHHFTTRLLSYRAEFGSESSFARWLGESVIARGEELLWEDLVSDGP